jgi:hypothetical protein
MEDKDDKKIETLEWIRWLEVTFKVLCRVAFSIIFRVP